MYEVLTTEREQKETEIQIDETQKSSDLLEQGKKEKQEEGNIPINQNKENDIENGNTSTKGSVNTHV